mgnify:FL=1
MSVRTFLPRALSVKKVGKIIMLRGYNYYSVIAVFKYENLFTVVWLGFELLPFSFLV